MIIAPYDGSLRSDSSGQKWIARLVASENLLPILGMAPDLEFRSEDKKTNICIFSYQY